MVILSFCLQLALSMGLCSAMSAVAASTGQAQPTRARMRITSTAPTMVQAGKTVTIAATGTQCAPCAWLQ